MERRPKVSVIIPTYNRKDYVVEAVDSVLNQTYRNFEVIVVDDGSTDGTSEILKKKYDQKIRYFYKENGGCASARNYGIKFARGEYIAFLDSDDKYLPDKLEDQVGILERNTELGFVYSDSYSFGGGKKLLNSSVRPDKDNSVTYALYMMTYMANGSFLARKKYLELSGYYNESLRYNEDTDFLLRLSLYSKVYYSKKPTLLYRVHSGRKSSNNIKLLEAVYSSSESLLKNYSDFKKRIGRKADIRLGQIKLDLSMEYAVQRDFKRALEELNSSNRHHPTIRKMLYLYLLPKRFVQKSNAYKFIVYFEKRIIKALQWYLYKHTGWI